AAAARPAGGSPRHRRASAAPRKALRREDKELQRPHWRRFGSWGDPPCGWTYHTQAEFTYVPIGVTSTTAWSPRLPSVPRDDRAKLASERAIERVEIDRLPRVELGVVALEDESGEARGHFVNQIVERGLRVAARDHDVETA